jgi:hypothetical protein
LADRPVDADKQRLAQHGQHRRQKQRQQERRDHVKERDPQEHDQDRKNNQRNQPGHAGLLCRRGCGRDHLPQGMKLSPPYR